MGFKVPIKTDFGELDELDKCLLACTCLQMDTSFS